MPRGTAFALRTGMARRAFIILVTLATSACVGDGNQPNDAGGDDATPLDGGSDAKPDAAPNGTCVFGTSHFDDGCKFGP